MRNPKKSLTSSLFNPLAGDVLAYLLEPTWALLLGVYVASAAENPPKAAARGERQCVGSTGTVPKNSGTWAPLSARIGGMYCRRKAVSRVP